MLTLLLFNIYNISSNSKEISVEQNMYAYLFILFHLYSHPSNAQQPLFAAPKNYWKNKIPTPDHTFQNVMKNVKDIIKMSKSLQPKTANDNSWKVSKRSADIFQNVLYINSRRLCPAHQCNSWPHSVGCKNASSSPIHMILFLLGTYSFSWIEWNIEILQNKPMCVTKFVQHIIHFS